jgi:hypothetical protein
MASWLCGVSTKCLALQRTIKGIGVGSSWSVQMHQREKAMRTDMWQRNAMEASACSHEYFDPCFIESWTAMAFLRPFSDLAEHRLTAVNTEPITN